MLHNRLRAAAGNRGVGISQFFAAGEQGVWYDPSDLSTIFQDTGGTTPVTTDGDPVRYLMDKSGNGVHLSHATGIVYRTDGTYHWLELAGTYLVASGSRTKMAFAHGATGYTGCYGVKFGTVANPTAVYVLYANGGATTGKIGINGFYEDRTAEGSHKWRTLVGDGRGVNPPDTPVRATSPDNFMPGNTVSVFSELVDPDASPVADRHFVRKFGDTDISTNDGYASPVATDASDEFTLGAISGSFAATMTGRIYQFVIVEGQLPSADRLTLETAVADKTP